MAEGLQCSYQPPVRPLSQEGLAAGAATITPPVGAMAEPTRFTLVPTEIAKVVEYRTASETEPLLVRPPHLRASYEVGDDLPRWQPRPLTLTAEDVRESPGGLAVQLPPEVARPRAMLKRAGPSTP